MQPREKVRESDSCALESKTEGGVRRCDFHAAAAAAWLCAAALPVVCVCVCVCVCVNNCTHLLPLIVCSSACESVSREHSTHAQHTCSTERRGGEGVGGGKGAVIGARHVHHVQQEHFAACSLERVGA